MSLTTDDFAFFDPGPLSDGVIDVMLKEREPANPQHSYVPQYHFWITLHGSADRAGALRLRVGTPKQLFFPGHIGYEVDPAHRGRHFAERSCRLILPVVSAHHLSSVVLTCRPDNLASRRTMERLGAKLLGQFEVPPTHEMYPKYVRKEGAGAPILRYEWRLLETLPIHLDEGDHASRA